MTGVSRVHGPSADEILGAVDGLRARFVQLTQTLARLESPSERPDLHGPVFDCLETALSETGYRCHRFDGRTSGGTLLAVPAERHRGRPYQAILGHVDTVWPIGTVKRIPVRHDGDRISGPGTFDMKAGLAMAVMALRALQELGITPSVTPVLHANSDEEIDSSDSSVAIVHLCRRADRVLVPEPAFGPRGLLKSARPGTALYHVTVRGRASHAGLAPEKGRSAILEASRLVQELHAWHDPSGGILINVGTISGGIKRNVVPDHCTFSVDVRTGTVADSHRIDARLRALTASRDGVSLEIRGTIERPPFDGTTPANRRLLDRALRVADRLGLEVGHGFAGGASDGNFAAQVAPTLDGLGPVGDGAHADHEHVLVTPTMGRIALMVGLILEPPIGTSVDRSS